MRFARDFIAEQALLEISRTQRWALILATAGQHDLADEYRRMAEQVERENERAAA